MSFPNLLGYYQDNILIRKIAVFPSLEHVDSGNILTQPSVIACLLCPDFLIGRSPTSIQL